MEMRWDEHLVLMEEMTNAYKILVRKPHMLKWMLEKEGIKTWVDSTGSGQGPMIFCQHGDEPSGSIKTKNFFTILTINSSRITNY
jgi:hypothetical protein